MGIVKKISILCSLLVLLGYQVMAQNVKKLFDEGKTLFDQKQYALALGKFAPITSLNESNDLVRYASYYYAIAAYQSGDSRTAKNMFLQVLRKYPDWEVKEDINYWLGFLATKEGDTRSAFNYLSLVKNESLNQSITALKSEVLAGTSDVEELKSLLEEYPEEAVASRLANQILSLDVKDQDIDLLSALQDQYDLRLDLSIDGIEESPKKEIYNVGLFLPFSYSEDSIRQVRAMSNWTTRMYQGVVLGVEKLREEGININLLTIDTRDAESRLDEMIVAGDFDDLDLIIGPVTQGAVQSMTTFSNENKINMINPLSSNGQILETNPFAFLYYPSNESIAIRAAEYATQHFTENKNTAIFYSGFADKPRADLYRQLIEKDSFNVTIFEGVPPNESVNIQQLLLEEEELDKDSLVVANMIAEMDSLREAEVEDWEIYKERDFIYDTLKILPDSIGHVFIASDFSSLASSALSGIETRPDTIAFLSSSRFLTTESSLSFDQLERLDATFVGSNFMNYSTAQVNEFREKYVASYLTNPVKEDRLGDAYIGYDITVTFGRLLHEYGKYFQVGLKRKDLIKGELTDSFNYKLSNDNRFIPFLTVRDGIIVLREEE